MSEEQSRFAERYDLLGQLGTGAVGAVWLVRDQQTAAEYAIKILNPELTTGVEAAERLRVLLESVGRLAHPNIVAVDEVVAHEGRIALVMRPVPGEDLRVLLNRMSVLAPAHAALLVAQLCDALAAAHAVDVAHGGVKPSNVLLEPLHDEAGSLLVGLTDFGTAALAASAGVTPLDDEVGQAFYSAMPVEYQAPEVGFGRIGTPAADIYATGILLYETLAGHPPFVGAPEEVLRLHREVQPPRIPGLPDPLWLLVAACLDKHPQHRPSATDLASLLREIAPAVEAIPAWAVQSAAGPAAPPSNIGALDAASSSPALPVLAAAAGGPPAVIEEPRQRVLTTPRRAELAAVVTVVVLAFTITLLFASIGTGPRTPTTLAANPSVPVSSPSASVTVSALLSPLATATATATASASATARPKASAGTTAPRPSPSPSAVVTPTTAPPTSPAPPSTAPNPGNPPVGNQWRCSNNNTSGGIAKQSCIGVGGDGLLYIKGTFTAPPGQNITDIRLTLSTNQWTYTTATKSCGGTSCTLTAGPYNPPNGMYWNAAGIDNSSHNETSPAQRYWQR